MTSKPDNTRKVDGRGRQGLRPLELFETIATEIERKHRAAQWMAEIPAEWTARVEARVASEIAGWPDETAADAKAGAPSAAERLASGFATFKASFEGAYQSLMEAMFPSVIFGADALATRGGTRSTAVNPGATGAADPQDLARRRPLTPAEEEVRARLPAWVVVPYAETLSPGGEFAILWTGEGEAPNLPKIDLRLNGQPKGEDVFGTEVETDVPGLPTGKVTLVWLKNEPKPKAFTIVEREDGRLVIDFMT